MRQVPKISSVFSHWVVGGGRLARHFIHFLQLSKIEAKQTLHPRELKFDDLPERAPTHVWILVSDRAIESVGEKLRKKWGDTPIYFHASGASSFSGLIGLHPLMTFGAKLYDLQTYRTLPWISDRHPDRPISEWTGGVLEQIHFVPPELRSKYHAWVSLAGNFPALLWLELFEKFERELGMSRDVLFPYLFQTLSNLFSQGESSLTGPLIRGDQTTIRKHLEALRGQNVEPTYLEWVRLFNDRNPTLPRREDVNPV